MKRSPSPLPATEIRLWWRLVVLLTSLLGMLAGPGLALLGMGFANATASGTGMALFLVSLWTVLGWRGLHRNRTITYYGLSLAWIWMLARLVSDFPATASSLIMVLFFWPLLTLPLGLAWLCGVLLTVPRIWWRAIALWRHRFDAGEPHTASPSTSQWISVTVKLSLLVIAAFGATQLVWLDRGTKIQRLARDYPVQHATQTNQPIWGACTMVFLGYQLTDHGAASAKSPEKAESICASNLADATAELDSIKAAGGRFVRLGASGDQLLTPKPLQEKVDDQFLEKIRSSGMQLVLVDTQHPKVCQKRKLSWSDFCAFQRDRIEYYQRRYNPAVYFVVCEPLSYHGFCLRKDVAYSPEAWARQLSDMCRRVKAINPDTRTGICLLVGKDKVREWEVWTRMKTLPELDILSVEIYQPEDFSLTAERLKSFGHPQDFGKSFWIAETYNGWALAPARKWTDDAAWLDVAAGFARQIRAEAVLVWTFGSFAEGGSFWSFMRSGEFAERWRSGKQLSQVATTFAHLAASAP